MIALLLLLQAASGDPAFRLDQDPWEIRFLPDGKRLFAVTVRDNDSIAVVWDLESRKEVLRLEDAPKNLGRFCLSADGESIGGLVHGCKLSVWDARTGRQRMEIFPLGTLTGVALSPDGKLVAHSDPLSQPYRLYEVPGGKEIRRLAAPSGRMTHPFVFSPDGKWFAGEVKDGGFGLWEVATGKYLRSVLVPSENLWRLDFSPDGALIAAGGDKGTWRIYRTVDGQELRLIGKGVQDVLAARFSLDGRLLLLGLEGDRVLFREIASGRDLRTISCGPRVFADSPDGRRFASATKGALGVWDLVSTLPVPAEADLDRLWTDLADSVDAVYELAKGGAAAAERLRKRLLDRPLDAAAIGARVADLANDDIAVRQRAVEGLEDSAHDPAVWAAMGKGNAAEQKALMQAMVERQGALQVASPSAIRRIRAVWALELLGARAALEELAAGPPPSRQVQEAKKALSRLRP